jgi:hypothetical protein
MAVKIICAREESPEGMATEEGKKNKLPSGTPPDTLPSAATAGET